MPRRVHSRSFFCVPCVRSRLFRIPLSFAPFVLFRGYFGFTLPFAPLREILFVSIRGPCSRAFVLTLCRLFRYEELSFHRFSGSGQTAPHEKTHYVPRPPLLPRFNDASLVPSDEPCRR